jgi:hypothetical protein
MVNKLKDEYTILLVKLKGQQNNFTEIERLIVKSQNYTQAVALRKWKRKYEELIKEFEDGFI